MQPEALNCPNCGGAADVDRPSCEFCGSRLRTAACRSCLGMMFLGSKFCTHCGSPTQSVTLLDPKDAGDCPRCNIQLRSLKIDTVLIRECERCGGFWSGTDTFESLCANKEQQSSVLAFIGSFVHANGEFEKVTYVRCPDCRQLMNRSNFGRASGVIIDACKQHGVWFDAAELPKILDFVNTGGLARQRVKEKMELEDELSRLRDERRRLGMLGRQFGGNSWDD